VKFDRLPVSSWVGERRCAEPVEVSRTQPNGSGGLLGNLSADRAVVQDLVVFENARIPVDADGDIENVFGWLKKSK
jgi:hypothetical protein